MTGDESKISDRTPKLGVFVGVARGDDETGVDPTGAAAVEDATEAAVVVVDAGVSSSGDSTNASLSERVADNVDGDDGVCCAPVVTVVGIDVNGDVDVVVGNIDGDGVDNNDEADNDNDEVDTGANNDNEDGDVVCDVCPARLSSFADSTCDVVAVVVAAAAAALADTTMTSSLVELDAN